MRFFNLIKAFTTPRATDSPPKTLSKFAIS
jgi:hypothetical protein